MSASTIREPLDHQYVVAIAEPLDALRNNTRLIPSYVVVVWALRPLYVEAKRSRLLLPCVCAGANRRFSRDPGRSRLAELI